MKNPFIETIESKDPELRNRPFHALCKGMTHDELLEAAAELERARQQAENLYERVRATLFLHAVYRFPLSESPHVADTGPLPYEGFQDLLNRLGLEIEDVGTCYINNNLALPENVIRNGDTIELNQRS